MTDAIEIHHLAEEHLAMVAEIYNFYIEETAVTFDIEPRSFDEWKAWYEVFADTGPYQCFVAEEDESIKGFACSRPFRQKAAYSTSVETSIYLAPGATGKRLGERLYTAVLTSLGDAGVHRAYAGITQPNEPSVALHKLFGFKEVGTFNEVGWKQDRYWDVTWYEKAIT